MATGACVAETAAGALVARPVAGAQLTNKATITNSDETAIILFFILKPPEIRIFDLRNK
jgi:hypothetical protein